MSILSSIDSTKLFFENLLYKDLLQSPNNKEIDDDSSTIAPESRSVSYRIEFEKEVEKVKQKKISLKLKGKIEKLMNEDLDNNFKMKFNIIKKD